MKKGGSAVSRDEANRKTKRKNTGKRKRAATEEAVSKKKQLSKLQNKFRQKLKGAQFRWINEELYTKDSSSAFRDITPEKFKIYHRGFAEQVKKWPVNPVRVIAAILKNRKDKRLVVADFGCGDAELSLTVSKQHIVHSFDLVAPNERVTACDMAHVPLEDGVVDVAVFCLSLMGTNLRDFIAEAFRVLKPGGELIVAEVKSRFEARRNAGTESTRGGDDPEVSRSGIAPFVKAMRTMHFKLLRKDTTNKMFVIFRFRRTRSRSKTLPGVFSWEFRPCVYKKR